MKFEEGRYYILVMRERFVLVARVRQDEDALFLVLDDAAVIRRWATNRGLGQLALDGPQPNTKFDPEGSGIWVNKLEVSRIIPCVAPSWRTWRSA
jgi:hypothetical protein